MISLWVKRHNLKISHLLKRICLNNLPFTTQGTPLKSSLLRRSSPLIAAIFPITNMSRRKFSSTFQQQQQQQQQAQQQSTKHVCFSTLSLVGRGSKEIPGKVVELDRRPYCRRGWKSKQSISCPLRSWAIFAPHHRELSNKVQRFSPAMRFSL